MAKKEKPAKEAEAEAPEDGAPEGEEGGKKKQPLKLIIIGAAAAVLVLSAGLSSVTAFPEAPPQSCASGTPVTVGGVSYSRTRPSARCTCAPAAAAGRENGKVELCRNFHRQKGGKTV
jgi:hypothetical protein